MQQITGKLLKKNVIKKFQFFCGTPPFIGLPRFERSMGYSLDGPNANTGNYLILFV